MVLIANLAKNTERKYVELKEQLLDSPKTRQVPKPKTSSIGFYDQVEEPGEPGTPMLQTRQQVPYGARPLYQLNIRDTEQVQQLPNSYWIK
uniref:Uncharacterized protein n=1 Tax=Daphnia magna TaxID=35525 RepID=A0A0P5T2U8_9CRUS